MTEKLWDIFPRLPSHWLKELRGSSYWLVGPVSLYKQTPVRWLGVLGVIILRGSDAGEYTLKVQILGPDVVCSEHGFSSSDYSGGLKLSLHAIN